MLPKERVLATRLHLAMHDWPKESRENMVEWVRDALKEQREAGAGISLPDAVWRSVETALRDYMRFGPGEFDAEHIPDEHLEKACRAIQKKLG